MSSVQTDRGASGTVRPEPARGETVRDPSRPNPRSFTVRSILPRTLFGRSLLIILTPVIVLQIVIAFFFFDRHWAAMSRSLAFGIAGEVALIVDEMGRDPNETAPLWTSAARTLDLLISFEPRATLAPDVAIRWNPVLERTLASALEEKLARPFTIGVHEPDYWVEIKVQLDGGVLTVLVPHRRLFSYTAYVFILWVVGASVLLSAIAILFMRNQVRPIRRLAVAAELLGKGQDPGRFKPEGAKEVRQAAAAFLVMRERIRRQIQQRTEMLAGVSHDLRTPLTRMKLELALLPPSEGTEGLKTDVADMEAMVDAYLAFARGEGSEAPVPVAVAQLIGEIVDGAERGGHAIDVAIEGDPVLPLRPSAIKRCIANLVGNALRYGDRVAVSARLRGTMLEIAVDDDGPGIPPALREEVFKPFFRVDESRNPATGGAGLGLTIARDVARGHGGDLVLQESPLGGLRALLRLPA